MGHSMHLPACTAWRLPNSRRYRAPVIAALTQLQVLSVDAYDFGGLPSVVADSLPWSQLRALHWDCPAPLPEVSNGLCWGLFRSASCCSTASSSDTAHFA